MNASAALPTDPSSSGAAVHTTGPVADLLAEQQDLTPVDRFSRAHDAERIDDARYRELIPSSAPGPGQQYAFEVDLDACSGCKSCVVACHSLNGLDDGESWRRVGTVVGGPLPTADAGDGRAGPIDALAGLTVSARPADAGSGCDAANAGAGSTAPPQPDTVGPLPVIQHVTSACHHCVDPACMNGCPVDAYDKDPVTGIVRHLDDQCIGCTYCQFTCPYEVPVFNAERGIVRKCDMCIDRLEVGEAPACVQACPTEAIRIRLIDVAAASRPAVEWPIPGTPARALTKPTTEYRTTRDLMNATRAADSASLRPGHAHTPLAVMLVLTQLSVGAFTIDLMLRVLGLRPPTAGSVIALAFGILALVASVFHLGRPLQAWRAWIGLRHSWLSREIVAFGAYAGLATAFAVLVDLLGVLDGIAAVALGTATAVTGMVGVGCSVLVYAVTGRRSWAWGPTVRRFLGTTVVAGLATTTTVAAITGGSAGLVRTLCALVAATTLVHVAAEAVAQWRWRGGADDLARTAVLVRRDLRGQSMLRLGLAVLGGLVLPLLAGVVAGTLPGAAAVGVFATAGAVATVTGEVVARRMFFAASVSPRMPGALP